MSGRNRLRSSALTALAAIAFLGADFNAPQSFLPAGTRVRFHSLAPASSERSKTGDRFALALLAPTVIDERVVVDRGAIGNGTVLLAGHAGTSGPEGDLTLRLDSIRTIRNNEVFFADQRLKINGGNRKVLSGMLGIIPFAGMGSRLPSENPFSSDPDATEAPSAPSAPGKPR